MRYYMQLFEPHLKLTREELQFGARFPAMVKVMLVEAGWRLRGKGRNPSWREPGDNVGVSQARARRLLLASQKRRQQPSRSAA